MPSFLHNSLGTDDTPVAKWLFSQPLIHGWIMDAIDNGSYVGALLTDLSKAFDTVPHLLLLSELMNIGCNSDVIAWFRNYLTDRFQRVITHDEITQWLPVSRGFPQGSGLSPLLFNIYVRKLPQKCISGTFQFADDTTLAAAHPYLEVVTSILNSTQLNSTSIYGRRC